VKAILTLALLTVLAFAAVGCGGTRKVGPSTTATRVAVADNIGGPDPGTLTVAGSTTIANVQTGTRVTCSTRHGGGASLKVPRLGAAVGEAESLTHAVGQKPFPTYRITVTHLESGSITVSCTHTH
jgi:hypothetical protein